MVVARLRLAVVGSMFHAVEITRCVFAYLLIFIIRTEIVHTRLFQALAVIEEYIADSRARLSCLQLLCGAVERTRYGRGKKSVKRSAIHA